MKTHLFVLLSLLCVNAQQLAAQNKFTLNQIIPLPVRTTAGVGEIVLQEQIPVFYSETDHPLAGSYLIEQLNSLTGGTPRFVKAKSKKAKGKALVLTIGKLLGKNEGYTLTIDTGRITVAGEDAAGLFYGVQSLIQLVFKGLDSHRRVVVIPCGQIQDYPRFAWRGMHLDVSRHFMPVEFIKQYIDILAMHKLNVFHWHLTDDQGWRIEIKKYPLLTEKGAWREGSADDPWTYFPNPATDGKPRYGGYYTQEQIREVVAYATQRGVTVVPEIELPGHSWAPLYAYPHLSCTGVPFKLPSNVPFEFSDPFCAGNEEVFTFLENVFEEVLTLFPSTYIHIGGDEAKKTPWANCPKCQQRMKDAGLADTDELQSYFVSRVVSFLHARGRKAIGWDEILEGGLAEGAAVMSWRGEEGAIEAAKMGHPVVMANSHFLYFNMSQSALSLDRHEAGRAMPVDQLYEYEPVPHEIGIEHLKHFMGIQACLWTEYVSNPVTAQLRILPRLCALSELAWTQPELKNTKDFLQRLSIHLPLIAHAGHRFYVEYPRGLSLHNVFIDSLQVSLSSIYNNATILYALDYDGARGDWYTYSKPFSIDRSCKVRTKTILPGGHESMEVEAIFHQASYAPPVELKGILASGVNWQYFEDSIGALTEWTPGTPLKSGVGINFSIPEGVRPDRYVLRFEAYIYIPENDIYTFATASDDGTLLYVDDKLLIDNDRVHGVVEKQQQLALAKGPHKIEVRFFEGNYGEYLQVKMGRKGELKVIEPVLLYCIAK